MEAPGYRGPWGSNPDFGSNPDGWTGRILNIRRLKARTHRDLALLSFENRSMVTDSALKRADHERKLGNMLAFPQRSVFKPRVTNIE